MKMAHFQNFVFEMPVYSQFPKIYSSYNWPGCECISQCNHIRIVILYLHICGIYKIYKHYVCKLTAFPNTNRRNFIDCLVYFWNAILYLYLLLVF